MLLHKHGCYKSMEQNDKRLKKELNGKIIRMQNFIRCLLLRNKLFPNSAANDSKRLLSHSFHGSGAWKWLSWVTPAQGFSQVCSQAAAWGHSPLKNWGWRIDF